MLQRQASNVSDAQLHTVGARTSSSRPHLVTTEHLAPTEQAAEAAAAQDVAKLFDRPIRVVRVVGQDTALVPLEKSDVRSAWSLGRALKRIVDVVGAVALGVVFSPLMLAIALILRSEGGPVIYRHRRIGLGGSTFECLKFRSMVPNAERVLWELLEKQPEMKAEWVRDHKLRVDPRITRLGRFLRRTSLDELPQIWNVLRGEMSLVGPRPIVREELMRYGRSQPSYLSAKPGITGLWQVTGRNNTDYRRRVAIDVYYVKHQSFLLDLYILFKTPRVVLSGGGAY